MKKVNLFLFFVINTIICQAQWTVMSQDNVSLHSLQIMEYDVLYATCGDNILKSYDGGSNNILTNVYDTTLLDVFFCNDSVGYCTGSYGMIFKTQDGGENWNKIYQDESSRLNHTSINFIHPDTGWIIGHIWLLEIGFVFSTTDGGISFTEFYLDERISSVHMFNSQIGFASTSKSNIPGYYQTVNGGINWEHVHDELEGTWEFCFLNDSLGYALGTHFYSTHDGGNSWSFVSYPVGPVQYMDLKMIDQNIGYLCGWGTTSPTHPLGIYKTMNRGKDWALQQLGKFSEIEMLSADTGYAVSLDGEIFKTMIGGIYVNLEENSTTKHNIYIKNGNLYWQTDEFNGIFNLIVYSVNGNKINELKGSALKNSYISIPINASLNNIYIVTISGDNNLVLSKKIIAGHN